jgi:hypothetical protein
MFDIIKEAWPNVTVNGRVLHSSSYICDGEVSFHAKWSEARGLLILQEDISKFEVFDASFGKCLNLVLKKGSCER